MHSKKLISRLVGIWVIVSACGLITPKTIEVNRFVEVTRVFEVTRVVEVPRLIQQTVVVTAAPPHKGNMAITQGTSLLMPRVRHTATRLLNGKVLLVGGSQADDAHLAQVEIFDPSAGITTLVSPLHTPRHDHSATLLLDGRVLVVGGYNVSQQWLRDAEIYDPVADTWTVIPPIYPHGTSHTATLLEDGRVLVVGGCIGSGICTERVEIFDSRTESWREAAALDYDRGGHTAILLKDGRVLVAGGSSATSGVTMGGDALLYDPHTNSWKPTGPMIESPNLAESVRLTDGRVLLAGGIRNGMQIPQVLAAAQIYNPASNQWSAAPSLADARYTYTLILLPNNRVLAVGGTRDWESVWNGNSFVDSIEVYDPSANNWNTIGRLPQPAAFTASSLLTNGRLWITGGRTGPSGSTYLSSSWFITP